MAVLARPCTLLLVCSFVLVVAVVAQPVPPNFVTIQPGKFSKRNYEIVCQDKDKKKPGCQVSCPSKCPDECVVHCPSCKAMCMCDLPGQVCGDPRFTGGDGNTFYFHGRKDMDFCLLSDADLHINAHFIGKRNSAMNRDFTWVQALGILFADHRLFIGAQKTVTWDNDVDRLVITFDDQPVYIQTEEKARWASSSSPALSITRTKMANGVVVELEGKFMIMVNAVPITEEDSRVHNYGVTPDDSLAHLDLAFKFYSLSNDVHGVLGQTYRPDYVNKMDVRAKMPVMGGAPNFSSSNLFSVDCHVTRFGRGAAADVAVV
ncbi:uncharacterized protein [Typha angustifolia]|uniref:uncharacterized protein n=1 Tax=Typha angustifolia TaxID=59011 RepID=UPI003C2BDFF5